MLSQFIVYLAGPYSAPNKLEVSRNIEIARDYAKQLWAQNIAVLCPHTNTAHFDGCASYETFVEGGIKLLRRCDQVLLLPSWTHSYGTLKEVQAANTSNIPVTDELALTVCMAHRNLPPGLRVYRHNLTVPINVKGEVRSFKLTIHRSVEQPATQGA